MHTGEPGRIIDWRHDHPRKFAVSQVGMFHARAELCLNATPRRAS